MLEYQLIMPLKIYIFVSFSIENVITHSKKISIITHFPFYNIYLLMTKRQIKKWTNILAYVLVCNFLPFYSCFAMFTCTFMSITQRLAGNK